MSINLPFIVSTRKSGSSRFVIFQMKNSVLALFWSSVTIFWIAAPRAVSIATECSFSTLIREAIVPHIPLRIPLFPSARTLWTPGKSLVVFFQIFQKFQSVFFIVQIHFRGTDLFREARRFSLCVPSFISYPASLFLQEFSFSVISANFSFLSLRVFSHSARVFAKAAFSSSIAPLRSLSEKIRAENSSRLLRSFSLRACRRIPKSRCGARQSFQEKLFLRRKAVFLPRRFFRYSSSSFLMFSSFSSSFFVSVSILFFLFRLLYENILPSAL